MKIILAIDSFKGSLTSKEVEDIVSQELRDIIPGINIISIPIADGGEGFLSAITRSIPTQTHYVHAHNPCMEIIKVPYNISEDGETAYIEMAGISGLPLIREEQRNPMKTTTFGTGELIKDALDKGCRNFIIGIGGSATNDAGTGMLQALGFRFLDEEGKPLGQGGEILEKIASIDSTNQHPKLKNAYFIVACDVKNPFYGPNGAALIFARQKGADNNMITVLDRGMHSFAQIIKIQTGNDIASLPGSGAAGGLGGGMAALLNCELKPGAEILLDISGFHKKVEKADLIITGEGKIDKQTLMGKLPYHILQAGIKRKIPVIAIAGLVEDKSQLLHAGFNSIYQITPDSMNLKEAMKAQIAKENIRKTIKKLASFHFGSPF